MASIERKQGMNASAAQGIHTADDPVKIKQTKRKTTPKPVTIMRMNLSDH